MSRFREVAHTTRGDLPESWHFGAAAVVTPDGELVAAVGSATVQTFLRSAAKPFQAMPLLLAGGEERFSLSVADVAVICASHNGTVAHVERVAGLLRRGGFEAGDLQCGRHRPYDEEAATALDASGASPSALHNNCSGKHAGMLLACKLLGLPRETYLEVEHGLHRRVLEELAAVCRIPVGEIGLGVDGCSAPCFVMSLEAAARGYAALAEPDRSGLSSERIEVLRAIASAMTSVPEMVSGPGSFTTRLMQVTQGRILAKEGAQGVYAASVRGPVALGVVLKIADGWDRARTTVVLDLLRQLGSLSQAEFAELHGFYEPPIYNRRGLEVGKVVSDVELEELRPTPGGEL